MNLNRSKTGKLIGAILSIACVLFITVIFYDRSATHAFVRFCAVSFSLGLMGSFSYMWQHDSEKGYFLGIVGSSAAIFSLLQGMITPIMVMTSCEDFPDTHGTVISVVMFLIAMALGVIPVLVILTTHIGVAGTTIVAGFQVLIALLFLTSMRLLIGLPMPGWEENRMFNMTFTLLALCVSYPVGVRCGCFLGYHFKKWLSANATSQEVPPK